MAQEKIMLQVELQDLLNIVGSAVYLALISVQQDNGLTLPSSTREEVKDDVKRILNGRLHYYYKIQTDAQKDKTDTVLDKT